MEGKKIIDQETIWRVRDGKKIDVWQDKWIKNPPSFKVQPPNKIQPTPMKVNQIMTTDVVGWNETMLKELMKETDAKLVGKIPLNRANKEDRLIWQDSINGIFSVKSTYYEERRVLKRGEVDRSERDRIWRDIWTAKVAPKIKYFLWKLIKRFLPTRNKLQEKGIQCQLCWAVYVERE